MTLTARIAAASLVLLAVTSCGGDDDSSSGSPSSSVPAGSSATAAATGEVVEVKATEALKFDPATLDAKVGTAFRGRLVQVGSIPHNIEIKEFGVSGSDTMVTKDGEAKEFTFTADRAGDYTYVCTIHPAQMTGTLRVA